MDYKKRGRIFGYVLAFVFLLFALLFGSKALGQDATIEYVEGDESHNIDSLAFYGERDWPEDSPLVRGLMTYELGSQGGGLYSKLGFPALKTCVSRTGADMTLMIPRGAMESLVPGDTIVATDRTFTLCVGHTAIEDTSTGGSITLWGQQDMTQFGGPVYAGLEAGEKYALHVMRDGEVYRTEMRVEGTSGDWKYQTDAIQKVSHLSLRGTSDSEDVSFTVEFQGPSSGSYGEWVRPVEINPDPARDSLYVLDDTMSVVTEMVGSHDRVETPRSNSWHGRRGDTTIVSVFNVREGGTLFEVHGDVSDGRNDTLEVVSSYVVSNEGRKMSTVIGNGTHVVFRKVRGDVNGDGKITWDDVSGLLAYLFLDAEVENPEQLDANNDGAIDYRDAVELYRRL